MTNAERAIQSQKLVQEIESLAHRYNDFFWDTARYVTREQTEDALAFLMSSHAAVTREFLEAVLQQAQLLMFRIEKFGDGEKEAV
jgi:hypothetical protein